MNECKSNPADLAYALVVEGALASTPCVAPAQSDQPSATLQTQQHGHHHKDAQKRPECDGGQTGRGQQPAIGRVVTLRRNRSAKRRPPDIGPVVERLVTYGISILAVAILAAVCIFAVLGLGS